MNKSQNRSHPPELDHLEASWEDHPFLQNLFEYRKQLLIGALAAILILLAIYIFSSRHISNATNNYITADNEFITFAQPTFDQTNTQAALTELDALFNKHPELHAKYDGLIAQTLIERGQIETALPFATSAIQRTQSENSPYYSDFTATTLLIGQKKYEEALQRANTLHNELKNQSKQTKIGNALFAFNLLRIAGLQQQLGLKTEELLTWEEWQTLMNRSPLFAQQVEHLKEGKVSLMNYIETRIKQLKAK